jgi:hypothetical protein
MRSCGARHRWAVAVVGLVLTVATLSSCGDSPSGAGGSAPQSTTSVDTSDLDSVAQAWGEAMLTSDWESVVRLIEPTERQTITDQLDVIESVTPPGEVTLRELTFEVVQQGADSAEVRYFGERCAPTISKTFGPSTVVGDAGSDSTSLSSDGVIVEGEVVCTDLGEVEEGPLSPARFVQRDGQWYGVLPGF